VVLRGRGADLEKGKLTNIKVRDLRHTCAALLLAKGVHPKGVHPKIVSEMLGHSSVSITLDVYSHVIPGLGEAAATAMEDVLSE
jgi:integrase